MRPFWSKLQITLPKALNSITALLAPSVAVCMMCGNSHRRQPHSPLSVLCAECRNSIPWITNVICPVCGRPEDCPDCRRRNDAAFICNRSAVRYDDLIRQWLALYKYRGHEALAPLLGEIMSTAYRCMMQERSARQTEFAINALIPVPVSEERLLERGFNQAERLAYYVAERNGLPLCDIMRRTRHSDKQSFKTRGARLRDSRDLFTVDDNRFDILLKQLTTGNSCDETTGKTVRLLIVDDIYTTGSTVDACAKAIMASSALTGVKAQPEIYALTLARS